MATTTPKKRKYTRRKIMADTVNGSATTTEKRVPTESSFMEGMRKSLTERDQEIKDRVNVIDAEMAKLTEERTALVDEQHKVQSTIHALNS